MQDELERQLIEQLGNSLKYSKTFNLSKVIWKGTNWNFPGILAIYYGLNITKTFESASRIALCVL